MIDPTYFEVGRRVGLLKRGPLLRLPNLPDLPNLFLSIENISVAATPHCYETGSVPVGGLDGQHGQTCAVQGLQPLYRMGGRAGWLGGAMYTQPPPAWATATLATRSPGPLYGSTELILYPGNTLGPHNSNAPHRTY